MTQAAKKHSHKPLFQHWLFCNILGFSLSLTLMIPMEFVADTNRYVWLLGLIVGVALSPWQAIALKRIFPKLRYWQWIAANIAGMYAAIALNLWPQIQLAYFYFYNDLLELGQYGVVIGLCVGVPQLIVLGLRTKKALWWLIATILSGAIAVPIGSLVTFVFFEPFDDVLPAKISVVTIAIAAISMGLLMGGIYSSITGVALVAITRSSQ